MKQRREISARAFCCNKRKNYPGHLFINRCVLAVPPVDLYLVLSVSRGAWWVADVIILLLCCKAKCKVHKITCHEGPEGKLRYSYTLSLTSTLDRWWVVTVTPWPLYLIEKRPGTLCIGGWVGPRADLKGRRESRPNRGSILGPSSP